jgi:hypothetical protein
MVVARPWPSAASARRMHTPRGVAADSVAGGGAAADVLNSVTRCFRRTKRRQGVWRLALR